MAGSSLYRFGRHSVNEFQVADIIFVHGLGGDVIKTWSASGPDDCWPTWLASDLPCVQVSSISYDAAATGWAGPQMPLQDRGTNILTLLEAEGIGARPIVFICHSLGGLVVKQMLRTAKDTQGKKWNQIRKQTRSIFFLATPHAGAPIVAVTELLRLLRLPGNLTLQLKADDPVLHGLNDWYKNNSKGIATYCFYEEETTHGIQVVNRASANIGMAEVTLVPLEANHLSICKPASREQLIYTLVLKRLVDDLSFPIAEPNGLSSSGIEYFVKKLGPLRLGESITGILKIFDLYEIKKKHREHTWLVATTQQLICITDEIWSDALLRCPHVKICWHLDKALAEPIAARDHDDPKKVRTGKVDIGQRRNWLYSKKLFPTHQQLEAAIRGLIAKPAAGGAPS